MIRVVEATTEAQLEQARRVLRTFPDHQREQYVDDLHIVNKYFDDAAYALELRDLGVIYGPPHGCVLLAYHNDRPAGAICLKRLDDRHCEMKRLFVLKAFRRKGIARTLANELLDRARSRGYTCMRLDTGTFMVQSRALYETMGFGYIGPYYPVREDLRDGLVYMELEL